MNARSPVARPLVIVPTYNEARNIARLVPAIRGSLPSAHVLVVDDNSPDGTAKVVEALATEDDAVHLWLRQHKEGLGVAYRTGYGWALTRGFDCVVQMDADFSHDPALLPGLVAALDDADLSVGSRYVPGGSIANWTPHRRALSRLGNIYVRWMLRLPIKDATAGFRAYRAAALDEIDYQSVRADGYGFQIEMSYRAAQHGLTVHEIPIRFVDRAHGSSKMSHAIVAEALLLVTRWGLRDRLRGT